MITILSDTKLIDLDGWDFPLDEIDYLDAEHDGEVFVIAWGLSDDGPRLCEAILDEEEARRYEAIMPADRRQGETYGVLQLYSRLLVNQTFSVFGTDEMLSLAHFYNRYSKLFWQTGYKELPEEELCGSWAELKKDIMDNIECLIAGSAGL